jgi:hypothetical protein
LSGGAEVEGGAEEGAEVGDGVEDEIDVSVGMIKGVELVLLLEFGFEFVFVMCSSRVCKFGWSSLGGQVRVFMSGRAGRVL